MGYEMGLCEGCLRAQEAKAKHRYSMDSQEGEEVEEYDLEVEGGEMKERREEDRAHGETGME